MSNWQAIIMPRFFVRFSRHLRASKRVRPRNDITALKHRLQNGWLRPYVRRLIPWDLCVTSGYDGLLVTASGWPIIFTVCGSGRFQPMWRSPVFFSLFCRRFAYRPDGGLATDRAAVRSLIAADSRRADDDVQFGGMLATTA